MQEYDGCSDEFYEKGTRLLLIYPPDDNALAEIKKYISEHNLSSEDVKITKNKHGISLTAKTDLTMTLLHEGRAPLSNKI